MIFKVKQNGVFQSRLVDFGYSHVAGNDFNVIYARVVNDITFQIFMVVVTIWNLYDKIIY
jgi:hypothetical protein